MRRVALALAMILLPVSLLAAEHFWIIGGGPTPHDSQAQIEFNVNWVIASLKEMVPDAVINVYYANGSGPEPATVEYVSGREPYASSFESLARVFGQIEDTRLRYRAHRVPDVRGSTRAESLLPELRRQLAALEPGDQGMIMYNGHGSWDPDPANNSLRLWGESRLDVREFEALLSQVDTAVPIRFVFTQCFSGAFERAVHPEANDVLDLAAGRRCGFFAESEDRESEGCSASIKIGDYRDYTTYFFAALTGRTRLGEEVTGRLDWDGDGTTTPFDAHLFALAEGRNADLPRSTSEVFLERWQPWYLRWVGTDRIPDNLYGEVAREIARESGLPEGDAELSAALETRYDALIDTMRLLSASERDARLDARRIEGELQHRVGERWPALTHPYTAAYEETVAMEIDEISAFIVAEARYGELVATQDRIDALALESMERDRDLSQMEKVRRTRVLARALDQLERLGSAEDVEAYGRLRSCEALPLGS